MQRKDDLRAAGITAASALIRPQVAACPPAEDHDSRMNDMRCRGSLEHERSLFQYGNEPERRGLALSLERRGGVLRDAVVDVPLVGNAREHRPEQRLQPLEDVEGVVADPVPVRTGQLRREHAVRIPVGVAADGGIAPLRGDVLQVVQAGEDAHLGENVPRPAGPGCLSTDLDTAPCQEFDAALRRVAGRPVGRGLTFHVNHPAKARATGGCRSRRKAPQVFEDKGPPA